MIDQNLELRREEYEVLPGVYWSVYVDVHTGEYFVLDANKQEVPEFILEEYIDEIEELI